jgi:DNA-binding transcriptional LysR family regulator
MTLDQLQTFKTVASAKSFGNAAEQLHLSQPAISKQIQALETELAQRLFERGKKGAQLTVAGTALLKHVEQLSQIIRAAKEEIADLKEIRGGHLAIGAAHSIATYVLPNLIETYRNQYPRVNLSIEAGWSMELTRRVVSYDLDLGLIVAVSPTLEGFPKVKFVRLATTELVFVVSPDNQLAGRKKLTWDDLNDVPWILNHEGCVYRSYVESRLKERGLSMKAEVEVIGLEVQKKLTALGLGIALLPKSFVMTDLQQGSLSALNVNSEKLQTYSYLIFRRDRYINGAMKAFLKLLQENFVSAKKLLEAVVE